MFLTEVFLQSSPTGFIDGAASQVLVAILAIGHVLFESHMDVMRVLQMKLYGLLRAQMAVAISTIGHFLCFLFRRGMLANACCCCL